MDDLETRVTSLTTELADERHRIAEVSHELDDRDLLLRDAELRLRSIQTRERALIDEVQEMRIQLQRAMMEQRTIETKLEHEHKATVEVLILSLCNLSFAIIALIA